MGMRNIKKPASERQKKVSSYVRNIISDLLSKHEVYNPYVENQIVTVSDVCISPDLRNARVYIYTMHNQKAVVESLNESKQRFKYALGKRLSMKIIPNVEFAYDENLENFEKVSAILDEKAL